LPFIPGAVSDWVLFLSDRYVIAVYHDEAMVGVYAGCYSLAQVLQLVSYPLEYSIAPVLPRLWDSGEHAEASRLLRNCFHLSLAILAPASTVMVLAGPLILSAIGSEAMAKESETVLPLLCWGITIFACTRMVAHVALVAHHGRGVMIRVGATAVLNIALNFALVPSFGAQGSAIATLLCYALYGVLIAQLVRPLAPDLVDMSRPARICLAALLPAGIAFVPLAEPMLRALACVGYLAAYVGLAVLLRAITQEDARLLLRTLRRR
jgi:O-antigen/teichoic acid export membrane protein